MNHNRIDKRNIMYIFNDGGFGGAGQSLFDLLSEIQDKVNPIVVIRDDVMVESKFAELGITCYKVCFFTDYITIGHSDEKTKKIDIVQSYKAALQLLPIIKRENIQLIHINSSVSSFAAIAALMAHVPYIWHIRELLEEQFGYEFVNEKLKKQLYMQAEQLLSISNYIQRRYEERYNVSTVRMYNGLNLKRFKFEEKDFRPNIFLVAAMITPEKGQWDVICAAENLVKKGYTDIKVVIAGHGRATYVWALKKYIIKHKLEKNISILPFQDDLSDLRKRASYAITCSQNEALGRVTIEAMLAGNVVIGAKSGGTTEIIGENEERGFLYELHNSEDLAETMLRVMQCPDKVKERISQRARAYAENMFDSRQYCQEIMKLYNDKILAFTPHKSEELLGKLKKYYEENVDETINRKSRNTNSNNKSALLLEQVLKWLEIKQNGYTLEEYFIHNNIYNIAIYGMGALGCRLYDELEKSRINIDYLIDRQPNGMEKVFEFSDLNEKKLKVDAIVVTVLLEEKQIIGEIRRNGYERVIGISEILKQFCSCEWRGGYLNCGFRDVKDI